MRQLPPPSWSPCAPSQPHTIAWSGSTFGWLLCLSIHWKPSKLMAPTLSQFIIFCVALFDPQMTGKRLVLPRCFSSPTSHPPRTPSFGWLLHQPIKQKLPKTSTPPISQFFDGFDLGVPNEGIRRSAHEPGRGAPAVKSSGATALRFGSMVDHGHMKIKVKLLFCVLLCVHKRERVMSSTLSMLPRVKKNLYLCICEVSLSVYPGHFSHR